MAVTTAGRSRVILESVQMQADRPPRTRGGGLLTEGLRAMRRTRIEKRRRPDRIRAYPDDMRAPSEVLDPRDPDILRAKRLQLTQKSGMNRL
jgi:hypothetical protein